MRVLQILEPPDGGVAAHVRTLTRELIARGHEVEAVVADRGPLAGDLRALGAGVVSLDLRAEMVAPGPDARVLRALARLLRRGRWDVVHTHGNKAGVLARPLAAVRGLPVVHSPHGFAYVSQRHRERRGQEWRRVLTLEIERRLARYADVIVCVSEQERSGALGDGIGTPDRLVVVHNGLEPGPDPAPRSGEPPVIAFVSRFHEQKAPLLLVEALAALHRSGPPFRARLVGEGPLEQAVRAAVSAAGLDEAITVERFAGAAAVLQEADLYVLPSLWESMPIGLLEAMAAGLPIVASDTGGVREVVADGETGLLVAPGEAEALRGALERLLGDRDLRERMGAAGRARLRGRFSVAAMIDGVERAYRRATAGA